MMALGVDPGLKGAFVWTNGADQIEVHEMPLVLTKKERRVDFGKIMVLLKRLRSRHGRVPVFLEEAKPMAMGSKFAFNYGRDFEKVVLALQLSKFQVTLVPPAIWAKEMHDGLDRDLKPKAKSLKAAQTLFPALMAQIPLKPRGGANDGPVDALLLACYGLRLLRFEYDFF